MTIIDTITASRICVEVQHLVKTANPDVVAALWAELDRIRAQPANTELPLIKVSRNSRNTGYPQSSLEQLFVHRRRA